MANNDRRLKRVRRNLAFSKTLNGIREKLPIFVIAAIAAITLSALDRSKERYETARNSQIEVDDTFVNAVKPGFWNELLRDPRYFKHHTFANPPQLLDSLAARTMAISTAKQGELDATKRVQAQKLQAEKTSAEDKLAGLQKQEKALGSAVTKRKLRELSRLKKAREEVEETLAEINVKLKNHNDEYQTKSKELYDDSSSKVDAIYNKFGIDLPATILQVQNRPQGLSDSLLKPILNDKSSLYVIFQILRVTALALLVLSFLFVLVMALRLLPLTNGSDTLTDQIRGLISLKGGGGQEVARAAILSVAAFGVGTAAVVAGNSISDKSSEATDSAVASSTSPILDDSRPVYLRNISNYYKATLTDLVEGEDGPPVTNTTNLITVPEPVVHIVQVSDRAGTRAIVAQLNEIGSRLPLNDVTALKASVASLDQNISDIQKSLGGFKTEATEAKMKLSSIDTSLTTLSTENAKSATAQNSLITDTNKKLEGIGTDISSLRRDSLVQSPRSIGRNYFTRATQFFGGESFAVSEHAYQSIKSHLPNDREYDPVRAGLQSIKYQLPADKGKFLQRLRLATATAAGTTNADALQKLKAWEGVILSYARLPR